MEDHYPEEGMLRARGHHSNVWRPAGEESGGTTLPQPPDNSTAHQGEE